MDELDIDTLLKAVNNDENKELLKLSKSDIKTIKNDILQQKISKIGSKSRVYWDSNSFV